MGAVTCELLADECISCLHDSKARLIVEEVQKIAASDSGRCRQYRVTCMLAVGKYQCLAFENLCGKARTLSELAASAVLESVELVVQIACCMCRVRASSRILQTLKYCCSCQELVP